MRWLGLLALIGLAACSCGATVTEPSESPSGASASRLADPTNLAVMVDLFAGANAYDVALVSFDARVVASAHAHLRTAVQDASELPYVSASNTRVYYLDGDQQIRWLKPDGTTGAAGTVPGGPDVHAAFAVTPDDSRIAVALLDYSVSPVALTLYVEDLGGAHHAVIFNSTSTYVWPVAWHAGQLVVAYLGPGGVPFKSKTVNYSNRDLGHYPYGPNPYGGINFHVIDPVTAQRETIISGGGASGLLTRSGSAVVQGDAVDWSGRPVFFSTDDYGSISAAGSLSPNGRMIAACCSDLPSPSGRLTVWYAGGGSKVLQAETTSGDWAGWFDDAHLITGFYQRSDGTPNVVFLDTGSAKPVNVRGIVAAMLPGGLDT